MKALVYHGPGQKAWEEAPDPKIVDPTDVIVQVDTTTICGTDLHILKGDVPAVTDGRILGHEGVGTIAEVGQAVSKLAVGDRVIISCITIVRLLLLLPPAATRALSGRRGHLGHRLDLRPPHRWHPGAVRAGTFRRQLLAQAA
jgi:NADPH:quinone reductase-like Zn-dependent oxidoreductase